jgi:ABC-type nitrate/sulfonate/bicarbonate transport system substrate-binding protein
MKKYACTLFVILLAINTACKKTQEHVCSSKITLQLNWTDDPTFTGEYVAKEKYWMLSKLDVQIKQGGIGTDPIAMIIAKKADYAVVGADKALIAISDNKPLKIVSIDLQRNPVGWIARKELKVIAMDDLKERSDLVLGDKTGTEISSILGLIIQRKQLNITPKPVSYDFSYFIANKNVIYPVYLNEEPVQAEVVHKININEIDPSLEENGNIKLYGNVIITHKDNFNLCKGQVDKFTEGLNSGWEFAKDNNDAALEIVMKYVKNDKEYLRQAMKRTVDFATNMYGRPVPAGHMEFASWEQTVSILKEAKLLDKDVNLNDAVYIR